MTHPTTIGSSVSMTLAEFNERVSLLLKNRPDPQKAEPRRGNWSSRRPQSPARSA